ncbi:uncharacterized protein LOC144661548 [Oculina patagonica]
MKFKVFLLCFAFLAVATSVCECGSYEKDSASDSVKKYTLRMNKDGKDYDEQIDINTEDETETFHVPKTSSDNEEGDIIYDFKKNLTMVRLPVKESCFLSDGTDDVPKPAELVKLLESKDGVKITKPQTEVTLKVIGTLEDRSELSDEMADLCAKLPIYVVAEGELDSTDMVQPTPKPTSITKVVAKRGWGSRVVRRVVQRVCRTVCSYQCNRVCYSWGVCYNICNNKCRRVC